MSNGASLSVNNSQIEDSFSGLAGGAVYMQDGGEIAFSGATLHNNYAGSKGGALFLRGGLASGGVYTGSITINNSTLSGNNSIFGGTIYARASSVTLSGNTITQNANNINSNVFYFTGASASISGSYFTGNEGVSVKADNSSVTISNSLFKGNLATVCFYKRLNRNYKRQHILK